MPARHASERQSDLDHFLQRLRALGASRGEMKTVIETWDTFDDDWTPQRRAEVVRSSDSVLRRMLEERRAEFPFEPAAPDMRLEQADNQVVVGLEPPAPPAPKRRRAGKPVPG